MTGCCYQSSPLEACPVRRSIIQLQTGAEFGTVLVFTCTGSCWPPGSGGSVLEEFVFLQEDPDQRLFV